MKRFGADFGGPGGARPAQYFDYGPLQFHINRAMLLAANRTKYRPEARRPSPDWIGPLIEINEAHVDRCGASRPVIFATLTLPGHPRNLLIDGNHRVAHALKHGRGVRAVVLDLEDTLKVLTGPDHLIRQIRYEGQRLGLLRQADARTAAGGAAPAGPGSGRAPP